jgi:hypothetical protein
MQQKSCCHDNVRHLLHESGAICPVQLASLHAMAQLVGLGTNFSVSQVYPSWSISWYLAGETPCCEKKHFSGPTLVDFELLIAPVTRLWCLYVLCHESHQLRLIVRNEDWRLKMAMG